MRKRHIFTIFATFWLLANLAVQAQRTTATVSVEPAEIRIGEQALVTIKAFVPKGHKVQFPVYESEITKGIEVLAMLPADTVEDIELQTITQKYVVTSFDSTLYHIPYLQLLDGTDTIRTNNGFGLKVTSVQLSDSTLQALEQIKASQPDSLDFEALRLNDITDVVDPKFVWTDLLAGWKTILLILGIHHLILIGVILVMLYLQRPKRTVRPEARILPPDEQAKQALSEIREMRLWQQGMDKEYHTAITDTLRQYIGRRFEVHTLERTSEEILEALQHNDDAQQGFLRLQRILRLADLVKFAKLHPSPTENEQSLDDALCFVEQTAQNSRTSDAENTPVKH